MTSTTWHITIDHHIRLATALSPFGIFRRGDNSLTISPYRLLDSKISNNYSIYYKRSII